VNDRAKKIFEQLVVLPHDEYLEGLKAGHPLVCMRVADMPQSFLDNKIGECVLCSQKIWYRPYNEIATNKICAHCAMEMSNARDC